MVDIVWQLLIVGVIFAFGVVSFKAAYIAGAPVWPDLFRIENVPPRRMSFFKKRVTLLESGEIGELINLSLIAGIALVVVLLTPDVSLAELIVQFPYLSVASVLIAAALVGIYVWRTNARATERLALRKAKDQVGPYRAGYRFYSVYCLAVALLMYSIFVITFWQIGVDRTNFEVERSAVLQLIGGLNAYLTGPVTPSTTAEVQRFLEVIYGRAQVAEDILVDQVNCLLMLLLGAGLAYVAAYHTPINKVFAPSALRWLRVATVIMVAICVGYGCFVFFSSHLQFIDSIISSMNHYEGVMDSGPWDLTRRYHEIVESMTRQRGIIGFLLSITSERGGLVLVIPVINMVLAKKDAKP